MVIKDRTAGEYSLEVFDSISDIPHAEDGHLGCTPMEYRERFN